MLFFFISKASLDDIVQYFSLVKVRAAHCKTNKAQTLYSADSYVCSIVPNANGTGFLSGHADGSIIRSRSWDLCSSAEIYIDWKQQKKIVIK